MKIRVAVKSCLPCLLGIAFGWCAFADVNVDSLLQESAMWLDASDPVLFQLNETGGVTNWINRSTSGRAAYGDAKAYHVNPNKPQCFGAVELVNGAPAYQMFSIGSYVDLTYGRISTIRTVFLVGDFENKNSAWNPLLGDSAACNFHRGLNGEFVHATYRDYKGTITAWHNSATTTVNSSSAKPTTGAMNFIILATAGNTQSDLLSGDRTTRASGAMPDRCAGRALHEVIIFTRR